MRGAAIIMAALAILMGCAWEPPSAACPQLKDYTPEFNGALADQLGALPMPQNWAIVEAVGDYYLLRKLARECE